MCSSSTMCNQSVKLSQLISPFPFPFLLFVFLLSVAFLHNLKSNTFQDLLCICYVPSLSPYFLLYLVKTTFPTSFYFWYLFLALEITCLYYYPNILKLQTLSNCFLLPLLGFLSLSDLIPKQT